MAGSDLVALPDGALDDVAARVGASLRGGTTAPGCGSASPAPSSTAASRCAARRSPRRVRRGGTDRRDVTVAWAPGAFELPLVARAFAHAGKVDAVLCLGAVIRGDTEPLRLRRRAVRLGDPAGPAGHRGAGRLRRPDDRHARAGARALGAGRDQQGPRGGADRGRDGATVARGPSRNRARRLGLVALRHARAVSWRPTAAHRLRPTERGLRPRSGRGRHPERSLSTG